MPRDIAIMLRSPRLPAILLTPDRLAGALDRRQLLRLLTDIPPVPIRDVKVIDTTGSEFRFHSEDRILAPSFAAKKWTKRQLIDVYNSRTHSDGMLYEPGSLPNVRLEQIVADLAVLLHVYSRRRRRAPSDTE